MDDLVTWLRAQIDEDEREVQKHPDGAWEPDGLLATEESNYPCLPLLQIGKPRALAEVKAKRRLLDPNEWGGGPESEGCYFGCAQLLALPYADRPGYRQEWRP